MQIYYEDDDLAVIEKPAGLVVNEATTVRTPTVQSWWTHYLTQIGEGKVGDWQNLVPADFDSRYGTPEQIFGERGGIVHRLDKETSGVLLLAKNAGSLVHLLRQFRERQVTKEYLALVHGHLVPTQGELDLPLARHRRERTRMQVHPEGRAALTRYQVVDYYLLPAEWAPPATDRHLTLVRCQPVTGRMHQIRAHFAHLGYVLVADRQYGGRRRWRQDASWCPRHFLHASRLSFTQPRTGTSLTVEVPLSADLSPVLSGLK